MAEMILYRGRIAVVPEKTYSFDEMRGILKRINDYPGVVIEIKKAKKKPSFLITIKTSSSRVQAWLEAIANDIGDETREVVSGRSLIYNLQLFPG